MVGSLLYATTTRPYILQVIGLVGRFQSAPKETHMKELKRILRYLKGTLEFGLWSPKQNISHLLHILMQIGLVV
jgi:predicted nucleic acid-binding protein